MKVLLHLIALFVITSKSVFPQPVADLPVAEPIVLTCPANPAQLASNISKQERQNAIADSLGLHVVRNNDDLNTHILSGDLVPVPSSGRGYRVRKVSSQFLKPHALESLVRYGNAFALAFPGRYTEITTLTRTIAHHYALQRTNQNAASCATKWRCTAHATGIAYDLSYLNYTEEELKWAIEYHEQASQRGEVIFFREMCVKNIHVAVVQDQKEILATYPQTPAEEDNMSRGTQPVADRDGGGR